MFSGLIKHKGYAGYAQCKELCVFVMAYLQAFNNNEMSLISLHRSHSSVYKTRWVVLPKLIQLLNSCKYF